MNKYDMAEPIIKKEPKPTQTMAPVKFIVIQMDGTVRGELTLDDETSDLYRNASDNSRSFIRVELCCGASEYFKTDCFVKEVTKE